MMKRFYRNAIMAVVMGCPLAALSGQVPDRETLNQLLADYAPVTEDFEKYQWGLCGAELYNSTLSANTPVMIRNTWDGVPYDLGTNWIVPGVTFENVLMHCNVPGHLWWADTNACLQPSQDLMADGPLVIEFDEPTRAVGLDLLTYYYPYPYNITITGQGGDVIDAFTVNVDTPFIQQFFGYENKKGISRVRLDASGTTVVDNVTFGQMKKAKKH